MMRSGIMRTARSRGRSDPNQHLNDDRLSTTARERRRRTLERILVLGRLLEERGEGRTDLVDGLCERESPAMR